MPFVGKSSPPHHGNELTDINQLFIHPSRIQWFFTLKGFVMPVVAFGLFGWCMAEGRGINTLDNNVVPTKAEGVPLGWAIMGGINTIMGSLASLAVTQPDLSRYCRKVSYAGWPQGIAVFVSKTLVFFLGLASTASIQGVWGKAYWNIWDLLDAILDHYWTPAARCAVFLASFGFYFSVIVQNIGTNTIAFGADLSGMIPQFMTIRRGQVLCGVLGVALVPWKILASASSFVTFLGAVPIFFGPLAGVSFLTFLPRTLWIYRSALNEQITDHGNRLPLHPPRKHPRPLSLHRQSLHILVHIQHKLARNPSLVLRDVSRSARDDRTLPALSRCSRCNKHVSTWLAADFYYGGGDLCHSVLDLPGCDLSSGIPRCAGFI